jgi:hypothetical protein
LAENQYFAILSNQLRDQVVEDFEFHWGVDNVVSIDERRPWFHILKQVRMIAYFF